MIAALFLFIIFIGVILIFSSKKFSPIPYFPSNKQDLTLIIRSLNLKNNQTVIDLGAGDGIVIFAAAKKAYEQKLNTKFNAVEINPILLLILNIRKLFHPNRKNIKIVKDDIFRMNFNRLTSKPDNQITIYLYISPWFLEKVIKNLKLELENFNIVSYMYSITSLKKKEQVIEGKNKIYSYSL